MGMGQVESNDVSKFRTGFVLPIFKPFFKPQAAQPDGNKGELHSGLIAKAYW